MKEQQKQHLINMMKQDEELGLYDEPGGIPKGNITMVIGKGEILPEQIWNEEKLEGVKKLIQKHKDGK